MDLTLYNYYSNIFKNNIFELSKIKYKDQTFYCVQDVLNCLKYNNNTIKIIQYLSDLKLVNDMKTLEQSFLSLSLSNNKQYCLKKLYIDQRVLVELLIDSGS